MRFQLQLITRVPLFADIVIEADTEAQAAGRLAHMVSDDAPELRNLCWTHGEGVTNSVPFSLDDRDLAEIDMQGATALTAEECEQLDLAAVGLKSINRDQGLYVIPEGGGYSCLGFEVAAKRTAGYARWLGQPELNPPVTPGTIEAYRAYKDAQKAVLARCAKTGERCDAELIPELIPLEGRRVEVTSRDGSKRRFIVGKSGGPIPIHLEVAGRDSSGGGGAYLLQGDTVRPVD